MDLITAIKSGRRIKRKSDLWDDYKTVDEAGDIYRFHPDNILADDWETEEHKVEITESEFLKIGKALVLEYDLCEHTMNTLAKELFGKKEQSWGLS